jgi:peptide/nickel transport system permease protein
MSIIKYIIKRLIAMVPVLTGVLILTFILSRGMPGDPVAAYLTYPDREIYNYYRRLLWLDRPILMQFFKYISDIFTGNWGHSVSINRGQDVWSLIMQRLPRTVDISLFSIIIASFLGVKTGVISAKNRNNAKDTIIRGISLIGVSMPIFFLAVLAQWTLCYVFPIFPATGFKDMRYKDPPFITGFRIIDGIISGKLYVVGDYIYHLALPVLCLSFITLAGITRHTRSSMLEVLELDYIRTARAKGCLEKSVINTHALKNSLIPTATVIGLSFSNMIAGAVLTEISFSLSGIGQLLLKAILVADYWVLNALVFLMAIIFVFINLTVDILYGVLDPRIRY